jgi:hypothetical protein
VFGKWSVGEMGGEQRESKYMYEDKNILVSMKYIALVKHL